MLGEPFPAGCGKRVDDDGGGVADYGILRVDRNRMTVHMTEAELARDLHRVLEKVRQGVEVVIEEDHRPVAVIKEPLLRGHACGAGVSPVLTKAVQALAELLTLPSGWNSHRAKPIDAGNVARAIGLLVALMQEGTPAPAVVPTVRGGVQLEWHTQGMDIEIYIAAPERVSFFAGCEESGESSEGEIVGQEQVL